MLFSSTINTGFPRRIRLTSISDKETILYVPISLLPRNTSVEVEEQSFNSLVLDHNTKKFNLVKLCYQTKEKTSINPETTADLSHLANMYEPEVARYLNLTSLMDFHLSKFRRNEVKFVQQDEITSAQKQLSEVYHQYAKSVGVDKVLEKKKAAFDTGASTPVDQDQRFDLHTPTKTIESGHRDEPPIDQVSILQAANSFPNRVDPLLRYDFFVGQKPPGLSRPVMYINSTKVKKVLNEKILQSNAVPKVKEPGDNQTIEKSQDFLMDKIKELKSVLSPDRKKPVVILEDRKDQFKGRLKFFNEDHGYGFVTMEGSEEDIFVYQDELTRAGLSGKDFRYMKEGKKLRVKFQVVSYIGKNGKSKKAVDLKVIEEDIPVISEDLPRRSKLDSM